MANEKFRIEFRNGQRIRERTGQEKKSSGDLRISHFGSPDGHV